MASPTTTSTSKGNSGNTNGGTETSFLNTPQAKDDLLGTAASGIIEYVNSVYLLNVLGNDLGGNGKQLWSVDDGVNQSGAMSGHEAGDLLTQDLTGVTSAANVSKFGARLSVTADGKVAYDPATISGQAAANLIGLAQGETLTDTFIYAIRMANGTLSWAKASVVLTGVNDAPVVQAVSVAAVEDGGPVTASFIGDDLDSDDDSSTLHYTITAQPAAGTLTNNNDGTFTYDPGSNFQELALDETLEQSFTYTATDKHGAVSAPATVKITVTGANDDPTLDAGILGTTEDGAAVTLDLAELGDDIDSDNDGGNLSYTFVNPPSGGTAAITGSTFSFDPGADFHGLAQGEHKELVYTVMATDAHGAAVTNTVTVTVTGVNDAPVITGGDTNAAVTLTPGKAAFKVEQWTGYSTSSYASLQSWASTHAPNYTATTNVIDYTDDPGGFAGEIPGSTPWPAAVATGDYRTYGGISDNFFARITTEILVTQADTYTFRTFNDDGVFLKVNNQLIISDSGYHPEIAFTGSIALTPGIYPVELYFFEGGGEASLEFTYKNSSGAYQHVAPPEAFDSGVLNFDDVDLSDIHTVTVAPVGTVNGFLSAVLGKDTTGSGTGGAVNWDYQIGNGAYKELGAGQTTVESFTVSVNDGKGGMDQETVTVTITGGNDGPTANPDTASTTENQSVTVAVLSNDTDPDNGDTLTLLSATNGKNGTVTLSGNDAVYTPAANFSGSDSFSYTIKDSGGSASTASVSVTVLAVNDPPKVSFMQPLSIINGSFEAGTSNWTTLGGGVDVVNWQAADGVRLLDLNAFTPGGVKQTLFTIPGATYTVSFNLSKNPGANTATVRVAAGSNTQDYIYNDANSAADMKWQSKTFTFTATSASTDLSFTSLTPNPLVGFPDDAEGPALDNVRLDAPFSAFEDKSLTIKSISVADSDAGVSPIQISLAVANSTLTLINAGGLTAVDGDGSDGTLTYTGPQASINAALANGVIVTPAANWNGTTALTATVNDLGNTGVGGALSHSINMGIYVAPVNDPAVLTPVTMNLTESNSVLVTGGTLTISDIDSPATFVAQTKVTANGTFTLNALGAWTYTTKNALDFLAPGQVVTDTLNVNSADGTPTTIQVNITGTVDGPDAIKDAFQLQASTESKDGGNTVYWVDWTKETVVSQAAGRDPVVKIDGKITVNGGQVIDVSYTGQRFFSDLSGSTHFTTSTDAGVYTSAWVGNGPGNSDLIALNHADSLRTLTFSEPVENLFFAIVSMNNNGYLFDQEFDVLSYGDGEFGTTAGYTQFLTPDGRYGISTLGFNPNEFHGVLGVNGAVETLTWASQSHEAWNGFTIGTYGLATSATVSGNLLGNDLKGNPVDLLSVLSVEGQTISGNSVTVTLDSGAIVKVDKDGDFLYDDNQAFLELPNGQQTVDSFSYTIVDNHGFTDTATVEIVIIGSA